MMSIGNKLFLILACIAAGSILLDGTAQGKGSIVNSKHDLSVTGGGQAKAMSESRVCIFCHTPHTSMQSAQLWNRDESSAVYIPYTSSSMVARASQPTGSSKLCLSCHDGTIALGKTFSNRQNGKPFESSMGPMPPSWSSHVGTDLSNDHPVSFRYDESDPTELAPALSLPENDIHLDRSGEVQCTSCHNVHDNTFGNFLVASNRESRICTSCHHMTGWDSSSHRNSEATWRGTPGADPNPWPKSKFNTVRDNGCGNCHFTHSAPGKERLMKNATPEQVCLPCHNGKVARGNVQGAIRKPYGHGSVRNNNMNLHDPGENYALGEVHEHVVCSDCHNVHQGDGGPSPGAPAVTARTSGVPGIQSNGDYIERANYIYEICYKCHGNDPNNVAPTTGLHVVRENDEWNTIREFSVVNASYHPIETPAVSRSPSLIGTGGLPASGDILYCHDCHNDSDNSGPPGPHSSDEEWLLVDRYVVEFPNTYQSSDYALCYTCHSETSILRDETFSDHRMHIVEQDTPCSVCHDPHGVQTKLQGDSTHLINFDTSVVTSSNGSLYFRDCGERTGGCVLVCHGENHSEEAGRMSKTYGNGCP